MTEVKKVKPINREEIAQQLEANKASWSELKDRLMQEELIDDDGYPTESALKLIEEWHWIDCKGLLEFIGGIWYSANWGWREVDASLLREGDRDYNKNGGKLLFISTAGWSGNESLIRAFKSNDMAWHLCWIQSRRGGHYIFTPHEFKDEA